MKENISSILTFLPFLLTFSCKEELRPQTSKSQFIINTSINTAYRPPCDVGFGTDTVTSFINFHPKDSNENINAIKVFTTNSSIFPDSFVIVKGFSWLDFGIIATPPLGVNGVRLKLEPNGSISCRINDVVAIRKDIAYLDTISTKFELGFYEDIVNYKGYRKIEESKLLSIHLPSHNNLGKNNFYLTYDTTGVDSGSMVSYVNLSRSSPDSAVTSLTINTQFTVTSRTFFLNFDDNGLVNVTTPFSQPNDLLKIVYIKKTGINYTIKLRRTLDGALIQGMSMHLTAYHGCPTHPLNRKILTYQKYNY